MVERGGSDGTVTWGEPDFTEGNEGNEEAGVILGFFVTLGIFCSNRSARTEACRYRRRAAWRPGPWTPSMRMPSTSAVLEGPVTQMMLGSAGSAAIAEGMSGNI